MPETVNDNCVHPDCIYRSRLTSGGKIFYCAYATMTGHIRGCPVSQCDKYKAGTKKLVMWNESVYVLSEGETIFEAKAEKDGDE